jgi:hypothetical protein
MSRPPATLPARYAFASARSPSTSPRVRSSSASILRELRAQVGCEKRYAALREPVRGVGALDRAPLRTRIGNIGADRRARARGAPQRGTTCRPARARRARGFACAPTHGAASWRGARDRGARSPRLPSPALPRSCSLCRRWPVRGRRSSQCGCHLPDLSCHSTRTPSNVCPGMSQTSKRWPRCSVREILFAPVVMRQACASSL